MTERSAIYVCTTCRMPGTPPIDGAVRDGALLFASISALFADWPLNDRVVLEGIACMSGCNRACTLSLSAPDKPSYLFGDLCPDQSIATQALELAARYHDSDTGILARADRPPSFRSSILARIPSAPRRQIACGNDLYG